MGAWKIRWDSGNRGMRRCLETHEFHNYCIMLQEGGIPGRLLASCLPVCLACLLTCLGCLARLLDSYLRCSRARALQRWGRKVRLRRGLCNPSLSGASPSSFRRSFYFFLRFVAPSLAFSFLSARAWISRVSNIHTYFRVHTIDVRQSRNRITAHDVRHHCRDTSNIRIPDKLRARAVGNGGPDSVESWILTTMVGCLDALLVQSAKTWSRSLRADYQADYYCNYRYAKYFWSSIQRQKADIITW